MLALLLLRDSPLGRPPRVPLADALATAGHAVREAWAEPGTRLGFWLGFMALFTGMTFGVMWGYPFLTVGQGLSPGTAGALMLGLALAGLVYGVTLGTFMARHPYYRSLIAIGVVAVVAAIWAVVLLWPGRAPLWLLVVLVLAVPAPVIGAVIDVRHRSHVESAAAAGQRDRRGQRRSVPGHADRDHGDRARPAGDHPRQVDRLLARLVQVGLRHPVRAVGDRRSCRRCATGAGRSALSIERDPDAYAALRRGVHLSPPM